MGEIRRVGFEPTSQVPQTCAPTRIEPRAWSGGFGTAPQRVPAASLNAAFLSWFLSDGPGLLQVTDPTQTQQSSTAFQRHKLKLFIPRA